MENARQVENRPDLPINFFDRMVRAGALAPSGDNLQPWSFRADGDALRVGHDPTRDLSLFNVQYLASFIALGAGVENITIAASNEGFLTKVEYFPDGLNDPVVASVSFERGGQPDPLAAFLEKRCTNRKPYENSPIPETLTSLDITKQYPTATLLWVRDKTKLNELGKIVSRADRLIFENARIHSHLFSTLRWTQDEIEQTRDGLPIASLELGRLGSIAFRALKSWSVVRFLNRFGFSRATAKHSTLLMQRCSAAGLITAPDTSPLSFLEAGRAFQRVWLLATQENLALQPMTAIIFFQLKSRLNDYSGLSAEQIAIVDALRRDLTEVWSLPEKSVPAMLFRVGFSAPPSGKTLRRIVPNNRST